MTKEKIFEKLIKDIEDTRIKLHNLINEKEDNLLDNEVIKLSKELDQLLSQYHTINSN